MDEEQISRDQWGMIFQEFSERHLEEYVVVRVVGDEIGEQFISNGDLPFQGVSLVPEDAKFVARVILGQEAVEDPDAIGHQLPVEEVLLVQGDEPGEETLVISGEGQKLFIEANPLSLPALEED